MALHDGLDDRQSQTHSAGVAIAGLLQPIVGQEDTPERVLGNTRSLIADHDHVGLGFLQHTPDAGPHLSHTTAIVGLGAVVHPVDRGSKEKRVSPFPYVDIRGLLNDRVFVSDLSGIGVKILNDGLVRAGVAVSYGGGRTSSDDPRTKGLPNIQPAPEVTEYIVLALKPVTLEAKVEPRVGKGSGMTGTFGTSYNLVPLPQLHLSFSAGIGWATARSLQRDVGVTPAEAAAATAQGNPLPVYTPHSGVTAVQLAVAGVYQFSRRWGAVARIDFTELVGASVRDSPLTERTSVPSLALGVAYMF